MTNELSKASKKGKHSVVEFAMASYGRKCCDSTDFFQLQVPFTTDVDLFADSLFELKTSGNAEYCGYAIRESLDILNWSDKEDDLKIIFIAGNERFDQGPVDFRSACHDAFKRNIFVNTIYCGTEEDGIKELWKDAAERGMGQFDIINKDSASQLQETIWDNKIISFNNDLNSTYLPYGNSGEKMLQRQLRIDEVSKGMGNVFLRNRIIFKGSADYKNENWDLVDAFLNDSLILDKLKTEDFPVTMQSMNRTEKINYINKMSDRRELCREGIVMYCEKANEFMETSNGDKKNPRTLDVVLMRMLREEAKQKGFVFD
ncbi:MAG TPA: hypothetical protein VFJ43_00755 [Bacteroidia bacterium]|nr:hypothetical protein [Bacteroidia bacterium]